MDKENWNISNNNCNIAKIFDVQVGKDGERECVDVYPRCILDLPEMLEILRRQGISFEIPGEERDCQIYFLWKKKDKKKKSLNPSTEDIKLDDEGNITETPEK